jgi:uncharacterized DUF497 family protein
MAFRDPFALSGLMIGRITARSVSHAGNVPGTVLHVTYSERKDRIRIISARQATKHEQDDHYRENTV